MTFLLEEQASFARNVRIETLRMVHRARASHIGGAFSMTDALAVLYAPGGRLRVDPGNPRWPERDRFILSKGHACSAFYAALALRNFFEKDELSSYARDESRLMAHASHHVPGVELSSGSLGHGLPVGCGLALGAKIRGEAWRTVVMVSDGELDEGSNWEALLFAPQQKLDNLWVIVDYNAWQSFGRVQDVIDLEPIVDKMKSFHWSVIDCDGRDIKALRQACDLDRPPSPGRPTMVIMRTTKGKGVSFMEDRLEWHYRSPTDEQFASAMAELKNGDTP